MLDCANSMGYEFAVRWLPVLFFASDYIVSTAGMRFERAGQRVEYDLEKRRLLCCVYQYSLIHGRRFPEYANIFG